MERCWLWLALTMGLSEFPLDILLQDVQIYEQLALTVGPLLPNRSTSLLCGLAATGRLSCGFAPESDGLRNRKDQLDLPRYQRGDSAAYEANSSYLNELQCRRRPRCLLQAETASKVAMLRGSRALQIYEMFALHSGRVFGLGCNAACGLCTLLFSTNHIEVRHILFTLDPACNYFEPIKSKNDMH